MSERDADRERAIEHFAVSFWTQDHLKSYGRKDEDSKRQDTASPTREHGIRIRNVLLEASFGELGDGNRAVVRRYTTHTCRRNRVLTRS